MSEDLVLVETRQHVRVLTMNRAEKKNAFNNAMYHAMASAIADARADGDTRVVLVTGAGGAFCAGQDMSEMSVEAHTGVEPGFPRFLVELRDCDKPIVTAVNGVGVGLGLTMLLHTDINYMARGARLRAPFVTLGVVPEAASSYLLPIICGHQRAAELLFTARWIEAEESVDLGIAYAVVEPAELFAVAFAKAAQIAAMPPNSVRHTKRLMKVWRQGEVVAARSREDAAFAERLGSAENLEAIAAFFEKRPADFSKLPNE
jgi:enoyl-CoA hydratase/carnithine racemase